jgi:hypothetical protein
LDANKGTSKPEGSADDVRPEEAPMADPTTTGNELTKLVMWQQIRGIIVHEDDLVHQRLTWLLTLEGFLMAGFFVVQSAVFSNKGVSSGAEIAAEGFISAVLTGALVICRVVSKTISAAYQQVWSAHQTWERLYPEEKWPLLETPGWFTSWKAGDEENRRDQSVPVKSQFPPIRGHFKHGRFSSTQMIPVILFGINVLASVTSLVIVVALLIAPHYAPADSPHLFRLILG